MKRLLGYSLVAVGLAVGTYHHYVTLDPLSILVLAFLMWSQWVAANQRQQLADFLIKMQQSHGQTAKILASKIDDVRAEIKRSKT